MSEENLRLSVSKTKTFIDCKKKYEFCYILKLPRKEMSYHVFGKFLHQILELFYQELINGTTDPNNTIMSRSYKKTLEEYRLKLTKRDREEAHQILTKFLTSISITNVAPIKVLAVEKEFNLEVGQIIKTANDQSVNIPIILNGMIDRIQIDDDGVLHISDYKTTKNKKYLKNDFLQLLTYAYAIYSENPGLDKIRTSYILLRHDFEYITKEFSRDEILKVKDIYKNYATDISNESEFIANPTVLCKYCDYLTNCESGLKFLRPECGETSWV